MSPCKLPPSMLTRRQLVWRRQHPFCCLHLWNKLAHLQVANWHQLLCLPLANLQAARQMESRMLPLIWPTASNRLLGQLATGLLAAPLAANKLATHFSMPPLLLLARAAAHLRQEESSVRLILISCIDYCVMTGRGEIGSRERPLQLLLLQLWLADLGRLARVPTWWRRLFIITGELSHRSSAGGGSNLVIKACCLFKVVRVETNFCESERNVGSRARCSKSRFHSIHLHWTI